MMIMLADLSRGSTARRLTSCPPSLPVAPSRDPTISTPIRVRKLDEQSTGQWPDAAAGKETFDREDKEEVDKEDAEEEEDKDKEEEEEDKEDAEEEEDDVDGGEVFLALAKGEMALSAFGKELSRHQGGPEVE